MRRGSDLIKENARRTLHAVKDTWLASLQKLTGKTFKTGHEYQRWHNKNKAKKW